MLVDTKEQLDAIMAWPNDTKVILWGPKNSGCPEYRHAYHLLKCPYQTCTDSLNVSIDIVRAHWKDIYQHADVRLAPLQNFNNSGFGCNDTESDLSSKRSLARKREFQYDSSGGQTFDSTITFPIINEEGLSVNGYASLDGAYDTDAGFRLDVGFSGTTGSLHFRGTTNNLVASLG